MPVLTFIIGFFLCLFPAWALPQPAPKAPPVLPASIRTTLDQEYPGWILAPVTAQIIQEFKKHRANRLPCLVTGDFDHDGHLDYAVQIALTQPGQEEQIIIVFLARGQSYEEMILQSMGLDRSVYLWVSNSRLIVLGGLIGETTYAFQDGRFSEIESPKNRDSEDSSVPHVSEPAPDTQ